MFNWSEKFILGIKAIDKEHKALVDLINELSEAKRSNKSDEVVAKVLNGLVFYTESHLANEEFLLKKYNYPEFHSHKSIHDDLIKQVLSLKKEYDIGNLEIATDLAILLNDWLAEHILVEDKKHAEYLKTIKSEITLKVGFFDNICVGIQKIDDDHSKTIELFNSIVSTKEGNKEEELMGYADKLIEHSEKHFKYEEDMMKEYKYPDLDEHKKEHMDILKYLSSYEQMFFEGFNYIYSHLVSTVNLWINEHIGHTSGQDKKLAKFLLSKGVI